MKHNASLAPDVLWPILSPLTRARQFLVAYSGGVDSHALLHMLSVLRDQGHIQLRAIHVNHGLSDNAKSWEVHCQSVCEHLHVPLEIVSVIVCKRRHHSQESLARTLRYEAISRHMQLDECVLTAHHQDDQGETVLLQLLRGAGIKGLSAMPVVTAWHAGELARPFLSFTRDAIVKYAKAAELKWVDDESNNHLSIARNYLRHQILPLLQTTWPSVGYVLSRTARHCGEVSDLLDEYAQADLDRVKNSGCDTLSVSRLLNLSTAKQKYVLRLYLSQRKLPLPSTVKLKHILSDVLHARPDASPEVCFSDVVVRRYRDEVFFDKRYQLMHCGLVLSWDGREDLVLPGDLGVLSASILQEKNIHIPTGATIEVRFRQGGEYVHLPGRAGSRCLKKLLQDWGVPPWLRGRTPLIYVNQQLIAVVTCHHRSQNTDT